MRTPVSHRSPPARIFAEQKSLRRTSASKFAARQHNHQLSCKPVSACKPERACYQKPQKIAPLKGSSNLEPPGFQKGRGPFVSERVQRKPFEGFSLVNFFLTADAVLLCAAKKNGVGTRTSWHVTPEAYWPYLATAGKTKNTAGVTRTKEVPYGRIFAHQSI